MGLKSYLRYMETNKKNEIHNKVEERNLENLKDYIKRPENESENAQTKTEGERKQKVSVTYTLRAFGENLKKLYELGLLTKEQAKEGAKLVTAAKNAYMGEDLNFD